MDLISRYREMMKRLLPFGMAWTRDALSTLHQLLDGLSVEFARIHERAEDLLAEMEPSGTIELLPEWESAWGLPNQCTGALSTLDERRAALLAKMIHVGQQTPGFFVRVAATLGYTIVIEENVDGSPAVWRIVSNIITAPVYARVGSARAGDPIRTWGAEMLECAMRALNPAHLDLLFAYIETAIDPALVSATIWPDGQTLALTFNQALSQGAGYSDSDFSIDGSLIGPGVAVTYVSGSGTGTHLYTVDGTVRVGETVTLTFTGGSTSLVRSDGAYLEPITAMTVFNGSEETEAPPSIVSATINAAGNQLTVVFSEAMSQGAGYQDADINLDGSIGGTDIGLTCVSGSGTDTWAFSIAKIIRAGEKVDLDFIGRSDGIEDADGNDLSAIGSMAVTNESEETFSDIIFWDGFEGGISGSTYTSTENDYPANHTGQITEYVYDSGTYKAAGLKSLWVNSSTSNTAKITFNLPTAGSESAGRVGFWCRMGTNYKNFFALRNSALTTLDYPILRFSHNTGNIVSLFRGYFTTKYLYTDPNNFTGTSPTTILNTWVFYEVAWDYYSFGNRIFANGQLISASSYVPQQPWTRVYDRLIIGADVSNGCVNYYDNFMISNDPNRDLYALALLEACPRV